MPRSVKREGNVETAVPRRRATTTRRQPSAHERNGAPTHEQIARRAYDIYLSRGAALGSDLDDWLQAERELGANTHRPEA